MYRTSTASSEDRDEILSFLEGRGMVENAWLIGHVYRASEGDTVLVCRRGKQVAGAACYWHKDPRQVQPRPYDYIVRMEAADRQTVAALIEGLPARRTGAFWLFSRLIQEYFDGLPEATREEGDRYFTVSRERFRPIAGEAVVELTEADLGLFEGREARPNPVNFEGGSRLFAVLREGRGAAFIWKSRPLTPEGATGRAVISICPATEPRYRRQGLGKRLVSYVTQMILREGNAPIYWTEPDDIAGQRMCAAVGYWQYAQRRDYLWRKR